MEDGCEKIFRDIIGNQFSSAGEDPSVIVQTANPVDRCVFPNGSDHFATDSESTRTLQKRIHPIFACKISRFLE